jgi:Cu(I)/Ag(I) efflux system membrane fusion protein
VTLAATALVVAAGSAVSLFQGCDRSAPKPAAQEPPAAGKAAQLWTCPMHPQVQQTKAGKCPICGMDLVPATKQAE